MSKKQTLVDTEEINMLRKYYNCIPILIGAIKRSGDKETRKSLREWDTARGNEPL